LKEIRLSQGALRLLNRYDWPGNVRELENILSRAVLKTSQRPPAGPFLQILPEHLAGDLGAAMYVHPAQPTQRGAPSPESKISLRDAVKEFQRRRIAAALENNHGNWAAAARELDLNRSNLHNLATRLGIRKKNKT